MGGFFNIGNSSAKTDRGRALGGWNAMWDTWSKAIGAYPDLNTTGQDATRQGLAGLDQSGDFWKSILTGDKTTTAAATAPAVNAAQGRADQARTEQAQMGTARGGGTAGYNTAAQSNLQADVNNAMFNMVPSAAVQGAQVGESVAGVGSRDLALALQALGISQEVANNIVTTSMQSRVQSQEMSPARIGETAILSMIGL